MLVVVFDIDIVGALDSRKFAPIFDHGDQLVWAEGDTSGIIESS